VTHQIWFADGSDCNSVAVGPHTILTASHCVDKNTSSLAVDSKDKVVPVKHKTYDTKDHVIVILGYTFKNWASISQQPLQLGQEVFIAGAPGRLDQLYRTGVYSGLSHVGSRAVMMMFQLPSFYGDSGSAIFNQQGEIITTITCIASLSDNHDYIGFACAYPLSFSTQQLEHIQ